MCTPEIIRNRTRELYRARLFTVRSILLVQTELIVFLRFRLNGATRRGGLRDFTRKNRASTYARSGLSLTTREFRHPGFWVVREKQNSWRRERRAEDQLWNAARMMYCVTTPVARSRGWRIIGPWQGREDVCNTAIRPVVVYCV